MSHPSLCPHCNSPLVPFNLLEDDRRFGVVCSGATLENGLTPDGLRCSKVYQHEFGFVGERFVSIDCKIRSDGPPTKPSLRERFADGLAMFVLEIPLLPGWVGAICEDQLFKYRLVVESWFVLYDPNEPYISPEQETAILADAEADRLGEEWSPLDEAYYPDVYWEDCVDLDDDSDPATKP